MSGRGGFKNSRIDNPRPSGPQRDSVQVFLFILYYCNVFVIMVCFKTTHAQYLF